MDSLSNHSDSSNKSNTLPVTYGSLQKRNGFADHEMLSYDHAVTLEGPDDRPTVLVKTKEHDDAEKSSVSEETEKPVHPLKRRLLGVAFTTLLCYICVAYSLGSTSSQYLYHRISKNHFNASNGTQSSSFCSHGNTGDNSTSSEARRRAQAEASNFSVYLDYTTNIPTLFICLFIGSYSDYVGRRILLMMALCGCLAKTTIFLIVVSLELDLNVLFLGYLSEGLFGSVYGLQLGIVAATSDVTGTMKERAMSFAFLEATLAIAGALAQVTTGALIQTVGYVGPAILCVSLIFFATLLVFFFMPETLQRPEKVILNPLVHLRKVFGFYILEGSSLRKSVFWCCLMASVFVSFCQMGRMMVETLYMLNAPLCWHSLKIGVYGGIRQVVTVVGGIVILKVVQNYVSHVTVGLIAMASAAASFFLEAFATTDWMMYLVPILGIAFMCSYPIIKLLMSKLAPSNKQGAVFSSMAVMDTICHLTSSTMYNAIYTRTLKTFSGAVFLLVGGFCIISMLLLLLFRFLSNKLPSDDPPAEDPEHEETQKEKSQPFVQDINQEHSKL